MSKDHWDAILASTPLNATAGRVTSGGIHYEQASPVTEVSWDAPPPMKAVTKYLERPGFIDLTGHQFGRLRVVGMSADDSKDKGALWVCRCVCGRYVGRRTSRLKKVDSEAMCNVCNNTAQLRYAASGDNARQRAEGEEARKW